MSRVGIIIFSELGDLKPQTPIKKPINIAAGTEIITRANVFIPALQAPISSIYADTPNMNSAKALPEAEYAMRQKINTVTDHGSA